ncbi:peptidoglycan recognition family protein [Herbaspirillum sp. RTI4]|uniref:peptidoglycan recognition protein family protein n=1 Tax=Herbaspirillum sp. RTI4 TaxID=3048640 RepID=UPI002AB3969F|nr:peptidoglycan recognition family protein [Herbaspirillum sp. RTI4]MDY7576827.1 peptidoglycan recognition family protein [Herbaspirillum sp. RTI4]MEA9981423.1 peptidoglycan recognition family protein [Herbaspirillum sp. RTI4]
MARPSYSIEHWTTALAEPNYQSQPSQTVTVNDRAATRQAIITAVRRENMNFIERSDWAAHKNKSQNMVNDWNYTKVAIHHAGRSFSCGPAALQMQEIQNMQMNAKKEPKDDFSYHYGIDCFGSIYEGRDIRFKGEHLNRYNTGAIGIVMLENLTDPGEGSGLVSYLTKVLSDKPIVTKTQAKSVENLIFILKIFFKITTLGGHREFPFQQSEGKICPGNVGISLVRKLREATGLSAP